MSEKMKQITKVVLTGLILGLLVTMTINVVDALYDFRIFLGILAGRFLVDPTLEALGKIKALQ